MSENSSHDGTTPKFVLLNARLLAYRKEFSKKAWLPNQLWEQKTTEHSYLYYNAMKPIFFILTMSGIFPAFKNRSGVSKHMRYLIGVYSVLVYLVFALLSGYTFAVIIKTPSFGMNINLTHTLAKSSQLLFLTHEFLYLFVTWKESDYVFKYVEEWNKLEEHFKRVTGDRINLASTERKIKVISSMAVVWVVFATFFFYFNHDNLTLSMSLVFAYQTMNVIVSLSLWVCTFWAISNTLNQYEKHFYKKRVNNQSHHQLQEFRLLWLHITNVMRQSGYVLTSTHSYFNITAYILNSIAAYSFIYDVVFTVQNNIYYLRNAVLSAVLFIMSSFFMFMFYNSPYTTAQKCIASVKSQLINIKPTRTELLNEVHLFIQTIRLMPPECNLRGFCLIDRKSFLVSFGTRITYLIILLQFKVSMNEVQIPSTSPTSPANVTVMMA